MSSLDPEQADPEAALRDARERFVANFPTRLSGIAVLIDGIGDLGAEGPVQTLRQVAHRMAGLAGMVGLPSVSKAASELEQFAAAEGAGFDVAGARAAMERMQVGFTSDLTLPPPEWCVAPADASSRVLVVEDDREQRQIVEQGLRAAGFRVSLASDGPGAVLSAKVERPDVILLDIDLPGIDGHAVCRQIKADPALSEIPVIFLSSRTALVDRMAGLTLGADDYITKPFEPADMLLRVRRLAARTRTAPGTESTRHPGTSSTSHPGTRAPGHPGTLDYATFSLAACEALPKGAATLTLVRCDAVHSARLAEVLAHETRRRDLIGRYSDTHLVVLTPEIPLDAARQKVESVIARLKAEGVTGLAAGVAERAPAAAVPAERALDDLLGEADLALAAARLSGLDVAVHGETASARRRRTTVLIAEDDPDVLHIIDPRLKAAGYRTVIALDGQQTLDGVLQHAPNIVLLDLMMPKLTGFEVLARLRTLPEPRPRTIVVSARGREEDVTRAFDLGADDYLTKPFSPQELVARIARLLR